MLTQNVPSHFIKLLSLELSVDKGSSGVTAAKVRNSVRQTGADCVWKCVIKNCVQILKLIIVCFTMLFITVIIYE